MRIKKNGKTINLTEADIKKLKNSILKEQNPDELKKLIDKYALEKNPKELEKLTDVQIKTELGDQNLTTGQIESVRALIKNNIGVGGPQPITKQKSHLSSFKTVDMPTRESVMKIKKDGETFNLTESDIKKLNVFLLTEQRAGIIQQGDTDFCLIVCNTKHAKSGSNGEMVKKIQHLLAANGFNEEFVGGGMESGCNSEWPVCDGKFRKYTKEAVIEFQKKYKLTPDGIVGPLTLKKMCEVLKSTNSLMKKPLCPDCKCDDDTQRPGDPPKDTDKDTEIDIDIYDTNIGSEECATIIACLRKVMAGPPGMLTQGTNKWKLFLSCIGKLKNKVFPPKKNIGKCKGCPKYVWYGPQVAGGDEKYWKRKGFETGCVRDKCSIATKDYRLYDNWKNSQQNA